MSMNPNQTEAGMDRADDTGQAIAVIDLGGQYCHMIGRRLRDIGIRADVLQNDAASERLQKYAGIILSGGPQSVYANASPTIDADILHLDKPILGICYGHQLLARLLNCDVAPGNPEYGKATLRLKSRASLFQGTPAEQSVWMSHMGIGPPSWQRITAPSRNRFMRNSCICKSKWNTLWIAVSS